MVKRLRANSPGVIIDPDNPPNYAMISTHAEGYSPVDLQDLVTRAIQQSASRAYVKHGAGASEVSTVTCMTFRAGYNIYARFICLQPIS